MKIRSPIRILILSFFCSLFGITLLFGEEIGNISHIFTGTGGKPHLYGIFESSYGNAGTISFDQDPGSSFVKANLTSTNINGFFWSQTTGWAEFMNAEITPKFSGSGVRETWSVSGYAWSDNAGWFTLSGSEYYPDTATLSGWMWSNNLGWVGLNTVIDNIGFGFIGRVKIVGNMGGKNIYNTVYNPGERFDVSVVSSVMNSIKKKVFLNMRNAGANINSPGNTTPNILNGAVYYQNTGNVDTFITYSTIQGIFNSVNAPRTLVIIGGDVYLDTNISFGSSIPPHAIIALKNDFGRGGNIYVNGSVTRIDSSLIAEGSLYSGRNTGTALELYNTDKLSTTALPNYQLYIHGSVISRNTIGGAGTTTSSQCPFSEPLCSYDQAIRYDLNYFRDFQTGGLDVSDIATHRGYKDASLDDYSLIIEYDSRLVSNPPPGL